MKRNSLILTAAVIGLTALAATVAVAHGPGGPGQGQGQYQHGPGMMQQFGQGNGQGYGPGMMQGRGGQFQGQRADCLAYQALETPLTVDSVRTHIEERLATRGNDRLKVGDVVEVDEKTIKAEIVTVDDSLVRTIEFDKATGRHAPKR